MTTQAPADWPEQLTYLTKPHHSPHLTPTQLTTLRTPSPSLPTIDLSTRTTPPTHIAIQQITHPSHPAFKQSGLFALQHLSPGSLVTSYLGFYHNSTDASVSSDYDISLDRDIDVAVDAALGGNEGRFVNDYRGVREKCKGGDGGGANAEFRDVWLLYLDEGGLLVGERGLGVFVLGKGRSGRKAAGIGAGEEVLVSYGKGFWRERRSAGD